MDVPLLWLPLVIVPVLVCQCMEAVHPALRPAPGVCGLRVWLLRGVSRTRGRPGSRGVPVHHPGCLPGEVLLLLVEGSVVPAPVLLPSCGRRTRTTRRSSPHLRFFCSGVSPTLYDQVAGGPVREPQDSWLHGSVGGQRPAGCFLQAAQLRCVCGHSGRPT